MYFLIQYFDPRNLLSKSINLKMFYRNKKKSFPVSYWYIIAHAQTSHIADREVTAWPSKENWKFCLKLIKTMLRCFFPWFTITVLLCCICCGKRLQCGADVIQIMYGRHTREMSMRSNRMQDSFDSLVFANSQIE